MNVPEPLTDIDIMQALETGLRVFWRRDLEKEGVVIIRMPGGREWQVVNGDWSRRTRYAGEGGWLREHGRLTSARVLIGLGLVMLRPVGPVKVIEMRDHEDASGWHYTPYAVDLGRLSPTARTIAAILDRTDRSPHGQFLVRNPDTGRTTVWTCDYKVSPGSGPYGPFERVAAEIDRLGWKVVGHGAAAAARQSGAAGADDRWLGGLRA